MKIGRSFYIRIAAIVLVILLGVLMFFIGKQHTILLDNNKFEDIKALDEVTVAIDGVEGLPIYSRMRDQSIVTGQRHTIAVTYVDSNWEEHTFERDIKIPVVSCCQPGRSSGGMAQAFRKSGHRSRRPECRRGCA